MRDRAKTGGFSSSDKALIENLYREVCGKSVRNTGCSDCYKDAYIETYLKLKSLGKMPQKPNYILKAGVIRRKFGSNKFYALSNCPDEVAEEFLRENPANIRFFEKFPDDWHDRVFPKPADGNDGGSEDGKGGEDAGTEAPANEAGQQAAEGEGVEAHADETPADTEKPAETEASAEEAASEKAEETEQPAAGEESAKAEETPAEENANDAAEKPAEATDAAKTEKASAKKANNGKK